MFSKKEFGQRVKATRLKAGETQEQLGILLSVYKSRISEIENGTTATTLEKVAMICQHYHVSADYLLCLTDDPEPRP